MTLSLCSLALEWPESVVVLVMSGGMLGWDEASKLEEFSLAGVDVTNSWSSWSWAMIESFMPFLESSRSAITCGGMSNWLLVLESISSIIFSPGLAAFSGYSWTSPESDKLVSEMIEVSWSLAILSLLRLNSRW